MLNIYGPRTECTKKPFVYQVAHNNLLTSCPEQVKFVTTNRLRKIYKK